MDIYEKIILLNLVGFVLVTSGIANVATLKVQAKAAKFIGGWVISIGAALVSYFIFKVITS